MSLPAKFIDLQIDRVVEIKEANARFCRFRPNLVPVRSQLSEPIRLKRQSEDNPVVADLQFKATAGLTRSDYIESSFHTKSSPLNNQMDWRVTNAMKPDWKSVTWVCSGRFLNRVAVVPPLPTLHYIKHLSNLCLSTHSETSTNWVGSQSSFYWLVDHCTLFILFK